MHASKKKFYFYRKETQKWEFVVHEKWGWEAVFEDGSILRQFDDTTPTDRKEENTFLFHQIREIQEWADYNKTRLHIFRMVEQFPPNGKSRTFEVLINPDYQNFIHLYKRIRDLNTNELLGTVYCFGYTSKESSGQVGKHILAITSDDTVLVVDDPEKLIFT